MFRGTFEFHKRVLVYQTHLCRDQHKNLRHRRIRPLKRGKIYNVRIRCEGVVWHGKG